MKYPTNLEQSIELMKEYVPVLEEISFSFFTEEEIFENVDRIEEKVESAIEMLEDALIAIREYKDFKEIEDKQEPK